MLHRFNSATCVSTRMQVRNYRNGSRRNGCTRRWVNRRSDLTCHAVARLRRTMDRGFSSIDQANLTEPRHGHSARPIVQSIPCLRWRRRGSSSTALAFPGCSALDFDKHMRIVEHTYIDGGFEGSAYGALYVLSNGQVWRHTGSYVRAYNAMSPAVQILTYRGHFYLRVEGFGDIPVERVG